HLLYTALVFHWKGVGVGPPTAAATPGRQRTREWLVQAGLGDIQAREFAGVMGALFALGAGLAFAIFGGILPALVLGGFAATFPLASYRARRLARRARAQEMWPRLIEEIRILTSSLGRSIPQALFE